MDYRLNRIRENFISFPTVRRLFIS